MKNTIIKQLYINLTIQINNINTIQNPTTASCNIHYIKYHRIPYKINISHHLTSANYPNILEIKTFSTVMPTALQNLNPQKIPKPLFHPVFSPNKNIPYYILPITPQFIPCLDFPSLFINPECYLYQTHMQ